MEFESFEEALKICVTAEEGSELQNKAAAFAIKNAPPELQDQLVALAARQFPHLAGGLSDESES